MIIDPVVIEGAPALAVPGNPGGPYVRGARDDRNLFLAWGEVRDEDTMRIRHRTTAAVSPA